MDQIGRAIVEAGHNLLVCSPFDDAADLPALRGAADVLRQLKADQPRIEYYYPDSPGVLEAWEALRKGLACPALHAMRQSTPRDEKGQEQLEYAWLLAQLSALDNSGAVLAVGGKLGKSSTMLLTLAVARKLPVLPLPYLGGAAAQFYEKLRVELGTYLGEGLANVLDANKTSSIVPLLVRLAAEQVLPDALGQHPTFFISYSRSRPQEADFVETVLRRLQHVVFRDDKDFGPSAPLPDEIRKAIHSCTVFIGIWCREYACSPWCFDEMELALELKEAGRLSMWIFCLDDTRMVPPKARNIVTFAVDTRKELEGELMNLLFARGPSKRGSE
jgi:hypothetical protein